MKISKLLILHYILFFIFPLILFSQNNMEKKIPLLDILHQAETKFGVNFSFANKNIENLRVTPFQQDWNLKKVLNHIETNCQLTFTFLTETSIVISQKSKNESICGYLIDFNTKAFVEGALVFSGNQQTYSSENGYFQLENVNLKLPIQISHISYPNAVINSDDFVLKRNCLKIYLSQKVESLKEVALSDFLTAGMQVNTDNSTVINIKEFGILPGLIEPDVLHQIQAIPRISSVNETISELNIRGGTNDQNLLLWDGIKMYHSGHFFGLISAFNPYLAEKTTIIKNGTSAQFNDGVSGTIDIQSINEIPDKITGGVGFNLLNADAYVQVPISKKVGFQMAGRRSITDFISTPTFVQYFNSAFQNSNILIAGVNQEDKLKTSSNFYFFDYNFKFLYDINEKHKLRVSALFVENYLDYTESINQEISSESKYSSLEQENMAIGAQLISKWNSNFSSQIQTYVTKYLINSANSDLLNDQTLFQNNEVLETGFKINTTYNLKNNLKFLNGYEFSELGITNAEEVNKPVYLKSIKSVERKHAVFSELNFTSKKKMTFITSGLRLNFNERFGTFLLEPRVQFLQKINSNFSLKLAGEFKSQTATQIIDLQEDFLGVEKRRWVLSDNKLIPIIKSKQASAGIHYKKNNLFIDLEAFQKKVSGITTSNQGFQNQNQYIKTSGDYFVNGIEFLINKKTDNYSTWIGYTYNNNMYNFPDLTPSKFPNNVDVRHAISYGNTYSIHKLSLALGIIWRTGKPHTTPYEDDLININGISNFINYNSPNSERLPNYFKADFSATYKFDLYKNIHSFVGVSILNLLNNKNILNTHYTISNNNELTTISNYSIKMTPNFTFRIMF